MSAAGHSVRLATVDDAERINDIRVGGWKAAYAGIVPSTLLDALDPRADDERRRGFLSDPKPGMRNWVSVEAGGSDDAGGSEEAGAAEDGGGYVCGWVSTGPPRDEALDETVHELFALYVDPAHWRGGHGAALTRHAVADARARGFKALVLWVLADNAIGRAFYEREGFRPDGAQRVVARGGAELSDVRYRLEL